MGTAWKMPLAVIGKPTGDGRQFDAGALGHRDLPLPLRYVATDSGGHNNAVIVGHISKIGKEKGGMLPAQGEFYDDESWPDDVRNAATAAMKFTQNKVIGPSVDLDQQEVEHVPEPKAYAAWKKEQAGKLKAAKMAHAGATGGDCGCGSPVMAEEAFDGPRLKMIRSGRMASATLVHIPAFAELSGHAKLTPIDSSDPNVDGTTSSAMVAGALVEFDWADVEWTAKIENDVQRFADQDAAARAIEAGEDPADVLAISEEMGDTILPNRTPAANRKKPKRDPETVKGSQDTQEMAAEGTGIWLTDDEFTEFAKRRLPSPTKQKPGGAETPGGDGEQGQGGGGIGGGTYAVADSVKTQAERSKLADEDFVDPKGRRFPIASCSSIGDAVSSYGRADPKIPYGQFKSRLTAIAKRKGCEASLPANWKAGEKMAALMAGAAPAAPPKEWFDDPKLTGPTPLHIGDDGRVYGHAATWGTCHIGIGDSCTLAPKSATNYAYFHTGEMVTADGSRIPVGRLSYGKGGHAGPNLGYRAAAEHYDSTTSLGALVRAGEDQYGIWVAGALVPEADEAAIRTMRATPLSGDWRRVGANLEMVAALHVVTAGFPIPRAVTASAISGMPEDEEIVLSLVSAGALPRVIDEDDALTAGAAPLDPDALGRAIARGMLAEQQEAKLRDERAVEWRELVAAATTEDLTADYDDAMGDLMVALVQE
jgi:hypothetical protein